MDNKLLDGQGKQILEKADELYEKALQRILAGAPVPLEQLLEPDNEVWLAAGFDRLCSFSIFLGEGGGKKSRQKADQILTKS